MCNFPITQYPLFVNLCCINDQFITRSQNPPATPAGSFNHPTIFESLLLEFFCANQVTPVATAQQRPQFSLLKSRQFFDTFETNYPDQPTHPTPAQWASGYPWPPCLASACPDLPASLPPPCPAAPAHARSPVFPAKFFASWAHYRRDSLPDAGEAGWMGGKVEMAG